MNISRQDIKDISDVEIAFGTTKCLPEINEIPKTFFESNPYTNLTEAIFYGRPIPQNSFEFNPSFDDASILNDLPRFVKAHLVSWSSSHEHKIAGVAYLISQVMEITDK